jgi:hypothetical protein
MSSSCRILLQYLVNQSMPSSSRVHTLRYWHWRNATPLVRPQPCVPTITTRTLSSGHRAAHVEAKLGGSFIAIKAVNKIEYRSDSESQKKKKGRKDQCVYVAAVDKHVVCPETVS